MSLFHPLNQSTNQTQHSTLLLLPRSSIKFSHNHDKVSDRTIFALASYARDGAKLLELPSCGKLTNNLIKHISINRFGSQITKFVLTSNRNIKSDMLMKMVSIMRNTVIDIDVSYTQAEDTLVIYTIKSCKKLRSLSLRGCNVTDAAFDNIYTSLKNTTDPLSLQKLNLEGCSQIRDNGLFNFFSNMTRMLSDLNLQGCTSMTSRILTSLLDCLRLRQLHLTGIHIDNQTLSDHLLTLMDACSRVTHFSLRSAPALTDIGLGYISGWSHLQYLDIRSSANINDQSLLMVAAGCPHLSTLLLGTCPRLGDASIKMVVQACTQLHTLDISHNPNITEQLLVCIGKQGLAVKKLDLSGCAIVSGSSLLPVLKKVGDTLTFLNVSYCNGLSNQTVIDIREQFPRLSLVAKLRF